MAHHKSAVRERRRSLRRNAVNQQSKSGLRSQVKKVREAIKNKNKEEAEKLLPRTFSLIDKTIKKGAIHKNKGRRYKSRLSRQVASINPAPSK
jgi:small subunit ribosomal protein S20